MQYPRALFLALFCLKYIYVSDMPLIVNSPIVQFVSDIKMFRANVMINDFLQLQQDINVVYE